MRLILLMVTTALLTSGCAMSDFGQAASGGAVYAYEHVKADGSSCSVKINSSRDVAGGNLKLNKNCELESSAAKTGGVADAASVFKALITKIPGP